MNATSLGRTAARGCRGGHPEGLRVGPIGRVATVHPRMRLSGALGARADRHARAKSDPVDLRGVAHDVVSRRRAPLRRTGCRSRGTSARATRRTRSSTSPTSSTRRPSSSAPAAHRATGGRSSAARRASPRTTRRRPADRPSARTRSTALPPIRRASSASRAAAKSATRALELDLRARGARPTQSTIRSKSPSSAWTTASAPRPRSAGGRTSAVRRARPLARASWTATRPTRAGRAGHQDAPDEHVEAATLGAAGSVTPAGCR